MTWDIDAGKVIWSDEEFDQINWHGIHLHAVASLSDRFELRLDIDFIVEWICKERPGPVTFRVAPATLVFDSVSDVKISLKSQQGIVSILEVERRRSPPGPSVVPQWDWTLRCDEGVIALQAVSFFVALRRPPVIQTRQYLSIQERGVPAFDVP